jgi:hypothetical protein
MKIWMIECMKVKTVLTGVSSGNLTHARFIVLCLLSIVAYPMKQTRPGHNRPLVLTILKRDPVLVVTEVKFVLRFLQHGHVFSCTNCDLRMVTATTRIHSTKTGNVVKRKIEVHSCHHFCSGKSISITYHKRVTCLSYSACNAQASYCHQWPVRLYNIFPPYLINGTILFKKCYWT